jgi:WD40 repeat protein
MRRIVLLLLLLTAVSVAVSGQDESVEPAITALAWSNEGNSILYGTDGRLDESQSCKIGRLIVVDVETSITQTISDVEPCGIVGVGFSQDGTTILSQDGIGTTSKWILGSHEADGGIAIHAESQKMEVAPTEPLVARILLHRLIYIDDFNIENPDKTAVQIGIDRDIAYLTDLSWHPHSSRIAASGLDGKIGVWDASTGELTRIIEYELNNGKTAISWSPNDNYIAFGSISGVLVIWGLDISDIARRIESSSQINDLDWHPDGTMLASASEDGTVRIWNAESGKLLETFTYTGPVYALDWSPDGTQIAFGGADTTGNPPQVMIVDAPQLPEADATPSTDNQ